MTLLLAPLSLPQTSLQLNFSGQAPIENHFNWGRFHMIVAFDDQHLSWVKNVATPILLPNLHPKFQESSPHPMNLLILLWLRCLLQAYVVSSLFRAFFAY
jgi:hypothetical protein